MEGGNMEVVDAKINGKVTAEFSYNNVDRFIKRQYADCQVLLQDGRNISREQQKSIYAFIGAIADWSGECTENIKNILKLDFKVKYYNEVASRMFSLASCDMTLAREFTKHLVNVVIDNGVPLKFDVMQFIADDVDLVKHFEYACLRGKKCCVCGIRCELHHTPAIGMGYNRNEIIHEGMTAQALCTKHHQEAHQIGQKAFNQKYHLKGETVLDKALCKRYGLKRAVLQ
jgi:hypothetical protein